MPTSTIRVPQHFNVDPAYTASYGEDFASIDPYAPIGFEEVPAGKVVDATYFLAPEAVERTCCVSKEFSIFSGSRAPIVIHGVHHVFHPPVALAAWPDEDRRLRIVFITCHIARQEAIALGRLKTARRP
ncbi:GTP-binding protein [Bradyrhizobium sp. BWA-3-5]|uniref:GTP-binding protein n=1 Tax=Bradyrhizobium sp. BWA-3-5 TaxID=3080013 RepID=UPI00397ABA8D